MKTVKLYWKNPYQKSFTAKVVDVMNGAIMLDKTLFYATGGNQIHDMGTIKIGTTTFQVINVEKEQGVFYHYIEPDPTEEIIGKTIRGKIDWKRRYSIMKAHSAQHIISAIFMKKFKNNTIHANIKPNEFSIELDKKTSPDHLEKVLSEANLLFTYKPKSIVSHLLNQEDALKDYVDKIRGKIPDVAKVRILEIQDTDFNTCGGTHVKISSEIGPVYMSSMHRDCEIEFICGENAVRSFSTTNVNQIYSQMKLNCSLEDFTLVFEKKLNELDELAKKQKELGSLLLEYLETSPYQEIQGMKLRYLDINLPKKMVFRGFKKFSEDNILIVRHQPTQYLILSSSKLFPAKDLVKKLKNKYGGKGGGSALNAQILFQVEPKNIITDIIQIMEN